MRVFNTPFNSPLNNTGGTRTETRTRTEVSSGGVRDVPGGGGGRPFDCAKDKDAIDRLRGWMSTINRNFKGGAINQNPNVKWQEVMREQGVKFADHRRHLIKSYALAGLGQQDGWTDEATQKRFNHNFKRFYDIIRQGSEGNACRAYSLYKSIKSNLKKGRPEDYYYAKIHEYQGDEERLERFKRANKSLLTTITEQRQITDALKDNLPGYLKQWEDNADGIRSKYKTYEDYVIAAEKWKKDNPGWDKEQGGSTTPWVETSRKTEEIERT